MKILNPEATEWTIERQIFNSLSFSFLADGTARRVNGVVCGEPRDLVYNSKRAFRRICLAQARSGPLALADVLASFYVI